MGRITTAGVIAMFPLTTDNANLDPASIITGPDHNLWFSGLGEIDRMTTTGAVTRFKGVGEGGGPDLTAGSDGNIWFADSDSNAIGRIDMSGKVRKFVLPIQPAKPVGIAAGAGGRVWVTAAGPRRGGGIRGAPPGGQCGSSNLDFAAAKPNASARHRGAGPTTLIPPLS